MARARTLARSAGMGFGYASRHDPGPLSMLPRRRKRGLPWLWLALAACAMAAGVLALFVR